MPELPRNSSELIAHQVGRHPYSDVHVTHDIMARVSFALVPPSPLSLQSFAARSGTYVWFYVFSDSAKAAAPLHEPTREAALRKHDVHEGIIAGFHCNRIKSQAVFIALDRTVEGLTETLKEAFWVDASKGFAHKSELAQLIAAWEESKIQSETKTKVDAVARALGEPISHLAADWESIMKGFKLKYGVNIP